MHPIICTIGPVNIYSWGLMVAVAFMAGLFTVIHYGRYEGVSPDVIFDIFIYFIASSILGARVFYVIGNFSQYSDDLISVFYVNQGGLSFLGGLLASLLAIILLVRYHKVNAMKLLDASSPATMLGYSIGRIGCYLNGCCYGIKLFGFEQPTQIYSSIAGLIMFAMLVYIYRRKKYDGQIFFFALFIYSIYRFTIDFIRYSPVHIYVFTPSQLIVMVIFVISSWMLWKKTTI